MMDNSIEMSNLTDESLDLLQAAAGATLGGSIPSTLSCIGIILLVFFKSLWKYHTARLLVYLTVSNFVYEVMLIVGSVRYLVNELWSVNWLCNFESFWLTWSGLSSSMWTLFLVIHTSLIYLRLVKKEVSIQENVRVRKNIVYTKRDSCLENKNVMMLCHGMAWFLPVIITSIAISSDGLGEYKTLRSHSWCWINGSRPPSQQIALILLAGIGWQYISYFVTVLFSLIVIVHYLRERKARERYQDYEHQKSYDMIARNFTAVMFCFGFCVANIWGTVRYTYQLMKISELSNYEDFINYDKVLFFFHCFGESLQPCVNFIVLTYLVCKKQKDERKEDDETTPIIQH